MRHRDVQPVGIVVRDVLPVHAAWTQRHASLGHELLEAVGFELVCVRRGHLRNARIARLRDARR